MADVELMTSAEQPSRFRILTTVGAVALCPLGLIVLGQASLLPALRSYEPPYVFLQIASSALIVRSIVITARWTTVGPGQARDRLIWGAFYLFCVGIFLEWALGMGASILAFEYALVTAFYWSLTRRKKKIPAPDAAWRRVRFDLSDLVIALVLFSLATAAGAATFSEWSNLREPLDLIVQVVFALPIFGFIGLIGFLVDAGLRDVTHSTSKEAGWTCTTLWTICSVVSVLSYVAICVRQAEMFLFALPAFAALYVMTAMLQESIVVAAGMRLEQTWVAPSGFEGVEEGLAEKQGDPETEGRIL